MHTPSRPVLETHRRSRHLHPLAVMDSPQDNLTPHMVARRQSVLESISTLKHCRPDQLNVLVDWAKEESIRRLVSRGVGPALNTDYFQWYVDAVMWEAVARQVVGPYDRFIPYAPSGIESVEFREGYERYKHSELESSRLDPQPMAPNTGSTQQQQQQPIWQLSIAPSKTSSQNYIWSRQEAAAAWQKVYRDRLTFHGGDCFRVRFLPKREPVGCVNWRLSRANQVLGGHCLHIVWDKTYSRRSNSFHWDIVLSPVSGDVNLDDKLVLAQLVRAWDKIAHWYEQMVSQDKDINLASTVENMLHQNMEDEAAPDATERHNAAVEKVNRMLGGQGCSICRRKKIPGFA
ncbi:hypothetical protein F5X96DRAFT_55100 [Biscogniauxia mediterranea]|nr:hypothetical protein F5X96DRAFT_55100 [Biscogniauxia mediterranea]